MTSVLQDSIRELLREIGPSTLEEILERLAGTPPLLSSKNPAQTVKNALTNDPACQSAGDGRYVYLPTFVRGASMRLSMELAAPEKRLLTADAGASGLLWPAERWGPGTGERTLALEGGQEVSVKARGTAGMRVLLQLPAAFWRWWGERRWAGHDALRIYCEDGEAGRFGATSLRTAELDRQAVAARSHQLREAAAAVLRRTRGLDPSDLARKLLARGIYHGEPSPDPLGAVLLESGHPFFLEGGEVTYRPEITPSLRSLLAPRFEARSSLFEEMFAEPMEPPTTARRAEQGAKPGPLQEHDSGLGYRIKVSLQWNRRVWRVIEILAHQTLEDLHLGIQRAFGWDNDHLYAFFMSGRAWDRLTEIEGPFGEAEPPTADEVTLAELGLSPGQKFLYIFDFGDELRHDIEVIESFPLPARGKFPRISERHGKAPAQYREWD